uniref:ubiquitinyl hydrolase 1 n=1 Tax=Macrostomum lignano TaxID=282301 RepID=A0A1I8F3D4_9PLAT
MFRERVLVYKQQTKGGKKDSLLTALADLFHSIASQKRKVGTLAPKKFIQKLKRENEAFDNFQQQDAHEFFNYLINHIADILVEELNFSVVFPLELSLSSTFDESNPERVYGLLFHCGCGPNRGHYITIVKSHGLWLLFDDDIVEGPIAPPQPTTAVPAASAASTATTTTLLAVVLRQQPLGNSGHSNQGSNSARPARGDRA